MPPLSAEIISIGDELTSGQRLDTNSQWLSRQLTAIGIPVLFHTTVTDQLDTNVTVMQTAAQRADLVLVTGGLGPTADDLTRAAIAKAANRTLKQDDASLNHITALFRKRGRVMPPQNKVQALFPEGATVIFNEEGTAPGIDLTISQGTSSSRFFCLPGVPAEMKSMFEKTVLPSLRRMLPKSNRIIRHFVIKTFGMGESDIEQQLPGLFQRDHVPIVGITASDATITLRITTSGETEEQCHLLAQPTIDTVNKTLGDVVYAHQETELQDIVLKLLVDRQETLSVWESGTRGTLTTFLQTPQLPSFLSAHFSVDFDLDRGQTRDSPPRDRSPWRNCLLQQAERIRNRTQSTYTLAVSPVTPETVTSGSTPMIDIALVWDGGEHYQTYRFTGHPDIVCAKAAKQAMNQLRLHLMTLPMS